MWLRGLRISIMHFIMGCQPKLGIMARRRFDERRLEKEPERINFARAVLMSAEAALLMKDGQRIKGLHDYLCNLELDMNLNWMLGCALQSQRKYESAIDKYNE